MRRVKQRSGQARIVFSRLWLAANRLGLSVTNRNAKGIQVRLAQRKTGHFSAYSIAALYAGLGNKELAFQWLNTAYQEHDWLLELLKTDFLLDPLRSDPRFADLVHKIGLPQ